MTHTTKHTPGPLKAVQIIIENSPCTWAVQRKSIREQWGKPSVATYIDNEADARLFAAAPAMYEELKEGLVLLEASHHDMVDMYGIDSLQAKTVWERIESTRNVIAQAEGKHD